MTRFLRLFPQYRMLEEMALERAASRIQAEDRERQWQERAHKAEASLESARGDVDTLTRRLANYAALTSGAMPPFPENLAPMPEVPQNANPPVVERPSLRSRQLQAVAASRAVAAKRRLEIAEALEQEA